EQSLTVDESPRWRSELGVQYRSLDAHYDYSRQQVQPVIESGEWVSASNDLGTQFGVTGSTTGLYGTQFAQLTDALGVEAGLRYDRQSYTGEHTTSPRVAASYALGRNTTV